MNYVVQRLVSRDTNSVLASLTRGVKACIIRKILPQVFPDKCVKQKLITVTSQPNPRPPAISFAFSQAKYFFFLTS